MAVEHTGKLGSQKSIAGKSLVPAHGAFSDPLNVAALSSIGLSQSVLTTAPKQGEATSTITVTDQADVIQTGFGRTAISDLDIGTTNPAGGIVNSSIKNVIAKSPTIISGDEGDEGITDTWIQVARLALTFEESLSHSIIVSQSAVSSGDRAESVNQTIFISQFADTTVKTRSEESQIVLTDQATADKVFRAVSTLVLSQSAIQGTLVADASSTIVLNQSTRSGPVTREASSTIVLTDEVISNIISLFADSTIVVSQQLDVIRPWHVNAVSVISGITDDIFVPPIGPSIPGVPFGLSQEAIVGLDAVRSLSNLITVGDTAQVALLKGAAIDKAATSTITLAQDTRFVNAPAESIIDSLVSTAEGVVNPDEVSSTLGDLNHSATAVVDRAGILSLSPINLKHAVTFSLVRSTTDCDYTPFIGESGAGITPPPVALPLAKSPPLDPSVRFRLQYPPFDTGDVVDTLDLRAPSFGNRERLDATRIQRETVGGTLIVFADPIWPKVHSLQMQFQALKVEQARGLMTFIERWLGQEIGIYDYEGRIWKGVITNPAEAVIQDGKESYSATLEIEAERV